MRAMQTVGITRNAVAQIQSPYTDSEFLRAVQSHRQWKSTSRFSHDTFATDIMDHRINNASDAAVAVAGHERIVSPHEALEFSQHRLPIQPPTMEMDSAGIGWPLQVALHSNIEFAGRNSKCEHTCNAERRPRV